MLLTHLSVFSHNKSVSVLLSLYRQKPSIPNFGLQRKRKKCSLDCRMQQYILRPPREEVKVLSAMFEVCPPESHFHVFARVLVTNAGKVYKAEDFAFVFSAAAKYS